MSQFNKGVVAGLLALTSLSAMAQTGKAGHAPTPEEKQKYAEAMAKLNEKFVRNAGQWDKRASFVARGRGLNYWLTKTGLVLDVYRVLNQGDSLGRQGHVVGIDFEGSSVTLNSVGASPLKYDRVDYMTAGTKDVLRNVGTFKEVLTKNLYPGISMRTYFSGGSPRYDLIVSPNADPSSVVMRFKGAASLDVKGSNLTIGTSIRPIREQGLVAYQTINGKRVPVKAEFSKLDKDRVGFKLGAYDHSKPLVIDPIVYGTYYGGDDGWDAVRAVVADNEGGVTMTGFTHSTVFPAIYGPYGFNLNGFQDAFVSKLQGDAYVHTYAAYVGGSKEEEGKFIQLDPFGNIWVAGTTNSSDFPSNTRPNIQFLSKTNSDTPNSDATFKLVLDTGATTGSIPWDASPNTVQTALEGIVGIGMVQVTLVPGSGTNLGTGAQYRIAFDNSIPNFLSVDSTNLRARYEIVRPAEDIAGDVWAAQQLRSTTAATAGNFKIANLPGGGTTADIPFNASPALVKTRIEAVTGSNTVDVSNVGPQPSPANLPTNSYLIIFRGALAGVHPRLTIQNSTGFNGTYVIDGISQQLVRKRSNASAANSGFYTLRFGGQTSGLIAFDAPPSAVQTAFTALTSVQANNAFVTSAGGGTTPGTPIEINFVGQNFRNAQQNLITINTGLGPVPVYGAQKPTDLFLMRFAKSDTTVLDPLPTKAVIMGGDRSENLTGFRVVRNDLPQPGEAVQLVLAGDLPGELSQEMPEITRNTVDGAEGFLLRLTYTDTGSPNTPTDGFTLDTQASQYVKAGPSLSLAGLDLDLEGNIYVAGTIVGFGTTDLRSSPSTFEVTPNIYDFGYLLRNRDAWVRKYSPSGQLLYSTLIGGNGGDFGLGVAVDQFGNAYVTGVAGSFNFPRTRGVFGETFTASNVVFVTKINGDASQLLYSTNLRTSNSCTPVGIAVDTRGVAHVTGIVSTANTWPQPGPNTACPALPTGQNGKGSIPVTADAVRSAYTEPSAPDIPSTDAWLFSLNPTGTAQLYGTYIGGQLDEEISKPYVDDFGDVWVCGVTDSLRDYVRGMECPNGNPRRFTVTTSLPAGFITSLAFKVNPDPNGGGAGNESEPKTVPYAASNGNGGDSGEAPFFIAPLIDRDGYILRFRIGLPTVANINLNPAVVAGGLGAASQGTVQLSAPAPAGGSQIVVTLSNTGVASFDPGSPVGSTSLFIPEGQLTAAFTVYTFAVPQTTPVDIKATYEGNFKIVRLSVVPWLAQLSVSPIETVGGGDITARVRLVQPAPSGGAEVTLTTNQPGLVDFQGNNTVFVPEGLDTATLTFKSNGVSSQTPVQITATLLGVGKSQTLLLDPANLFSVTFDPPRVTSLSSATGTVKLNGAAGDKPFVVNLSVQGGTPAGYVITPSQLTFQPGETEKTFTVKTGYEANSTQRVIIASRPAGNGYSASTVQGTLFVDSASLLSFTVDPTDVPGGTDVTGTVTISAPANAGGTIVKVSAGGGAAAPADVVVPAGQTQTTFTIKTATVLDDKVVGVTASRGGGTPITRFITLRGLTFTLTIDPSSVLGGEPTTATLTLSNAAPGAGVPVQVSLNPGSVASAPATVTVPAGQKTVTIPITTNSVTSDVDVTLSATISTNNTKTATFTVRAPRLAGISFSPSTVPGLTSPQLTVTLDAPAPSGGATVQLQNSNPNIVTIPSTVFIAAGQTSITFAVPTRRVPRTLTAQVTAIYGISAESTTLTVTIR